MPRYRTLNNDTEINVDGVRVRADNDGLFTAAAGSRLEAVMIAGGALNGGNIVTLAAASAGNNGLIDPESGGIIQAKLGRSIATRILSSNLSVVTNQLGNTFSLGAKLADKFDAVRLIYHNMAATQTVGMSAAFSTAADVTSVHNSTGVWVTAAMANAAVGTVANPSWNYSDWAELDGESQIVYARLSIPAAGNTENTIAGFYIVAPATTNPRVQTGDEWFTAKQAGDLASTAQSTFTSTFVMDWSPIIGIQYRARGMVHTVLGNGDSITSGSKTIFPADPFWAKAVRALKLEGHKVEACNLGIPGQTTTTYLTRAQTALTELAPSVMIYSAFSPNDGNPTAALSLSMRNRLAQVRHSAKVSGTLLIPFTGIPKCVTNESTSAWTIAQNDFRQSVNNVARGLPYHIDLDAMVATGTAIGTAPGVQTGYMDADLLHLSENGNRAAEAHSKAVIKRAISL